MFGFLNTIVFIALLNTIVSTGAIRTAGLVAVAGIHCNAFRLRTLRREWDWDDAAGREGGTGCAICVDCHEYNSRDTRCG